MFFMGEGGVHAPVGGKVGDASGIGIDFVPHWPVVPVLWGTVFTSDQNIFILHIIINTH